MSPAPGLRVPAAPPASEAELLSRAAGLAGHTLAELGAAAGVPVPQDQRRAKGLVGALVERLLGADASSRDLPDFTGLGVELKTLPLDRRLRPKETTFVCSIPLEQVAGLPWCDSRVRRKLARVLWVPVEADPAVPLAERRIGRAHLWSPTLEQEGTLRADWEEIAEVIACGDVEQLTAHLGRALQVRPKAAHSGVRRRARDAEGAPLATLPRGFYLRTWFTADVLATHQ